MPTTDEFFISDNKINLPEELDYIRVDDIIRATEAFARSTYQSVYIIDYFRKNFLYVSPNPILLGNIPADKMKNLSYRFYLDYVPDDEQSLLLKFNRAGFEFYEQLPIDNRKDWYITYDFHIINNGRKILINHKLTPIALTSDGRIWLALCVVGMSSRTEAGNAEIHCSDSPDFFKYNPITGRWVKGSVPRLTEREKTVITLSIQGYTMTEIADKMCVAPDTVKKYRQRIFEKLTVRNISEAIIAATNNRLL